MADSHMTRGAAPGTGPAPAPYSRAVMTSGDFVSRPLEAPAGSRITVRSETPLLPRAAFVLITFASLAGVYFTGRMHGLTGFGLFWRWTAIWSPALVTGFLAWRLFYLRRAEAGLSPERVGALHAALLDRVRVVGRYLALFSLVAASAPFVVPYLADWHRFGLVGASLIAAAVTPFAWRSKLLAGLGLVAGGASLVLWSVADSAGLPYLTLVRGAHLLAFSLWLGGALFNLGAAVPAGRKHANLHAVVAGARQLERFRWVVRTSLPTIVLTGLWMALRYAGVGSPFWREGIGLLIPLKLGLIAALVVIFITCPLYRACSPVRGVCNVEDLGDAS